MFLCFFFFSSRRRHTRLQGDWSSDVCSSDLVYLALSINVYLEANVFGVFRLAYSRLGPTEIRILLIALNAGFAVSGVGRGVYLIANATLALLGIGMLVMRSEEHTSELQSPCNLVCRLLLEKKKMTL